MKHTIHKIIIISALSLFGALLYSAQAHAQTVPPQSYPAPGNYGSGVRVLLSSTEPATHIIKYTTDGSTPSCPPTANGTTFSSRINLIANTNILAITCVVGGFSTVSSFTYTFASGSGGGGSSNNPTRRPRLQY
ncbi:MAG: chitobiase/beta-hexosaminidase C-terminal domain-containing protein [Candidatus Pacebacteria bacterium]|nr:chitobiase/beta-hexosaminidase C-terminal domain-containing protein [Candidatus Paceibacterota bacterium]